MEGGWKEDGVPKILWRELLKNSQSKAGGGKVVVAVRRAKNVSAGETTVSLGMLIGGATEERSARHRRADVAARVSGLGGRVAADAEGQ